MIPDDMIPDDVERRVDALVVRAREDPHDDLLCRFNRDHEPVRANERRWGVGDPDLVVWRCKRCGVPLAAPPEDEEFISAEFIAYSGSPVEDPDEQARLNRILAEGRSYRRYGRTPDHYPEGTP